MLQTEILSVLKIFWQGNATCQSIRLIDADITNLHHLRAVELANGPAAAQGQVQQNEHWLLKFWRRRRFPHFAAVEIGFNDGGGEQHAISVELAGELAGRHIDDMASAERCFWRAPDM